jgi:hypothetical protein
MGPTHQKISLDELMPPRLFTAGKITRGIQDARIVLETG